MAPTFKEVRTVANHESCVTHRAGKEAVRRESVLCFENFVPVSGRARVAVPHCGGHFDHVDLETILLVGSEGESIAVAHLASSVIDVFETLRHEAVVFLGGSLRWHFGTDQENGLVVLGCKSIRGRCVERARLK